MPDCSYCEASFDDEEAYVDHLAAEHEDELSTIDRRRVAQHTDDDSGVPVGPLVLGIVIAFAVVVVVYVTFFFGGSSGGIGPAGSTHEHGTINVTIAGETLDFSRGRFQGQARKFHFEKGTEIWHKHATGVTVKYAMATLGIQVSEDRVTYRGTTYRESDPGTSIVVTVNGNSVDPSEYVIQGVPPGTDPSKGDHIRIVVRTNGSG